MFGKTQPTAGKSLVVYATQPPNFEPSKLERIFSSISRFIKYTWYGDVDGEATYDSFVVFIVVRTFLVFCFALAVISMNPHDPFFTNGTATNYKDYFANPTLLYDNLFFFLRWLYVPLLLSLMIGGVFALIMLPDYFREKAANREKLKEQWQKHQEMVALEQRRAAEQRQKEQQAEIARNVYQIKQAATYRVQRRAEIVDSIHAALDRRIRQNFGNDDPEVPYTQVRQDLKNGPRPPDLGLLHDVIDPEIRRVIGDPSWLPANPSDALLLGQSRIF